MSFPPELREALLISARLPARNANVATFQQRRFQLVLGRREGFLVFPRESIFLLFVRAWLIGQNRKKRQSSVQHVASETREHRLDSHATMIDQPSEATSSKSKIVAEVSTPTEVTHPVPAVPFAAEPITPETKTHALLTVTPPSPPRSAARRGVVSIDDRPQVDVVQNYEAWAWTPKKKMATRSSASSSSGSASS